MARLTVRMRTQAGFLACVLVCACKTVSPVVAELPAPPEFWGAAPLVHGDWVSACDNTGACTMVGFPPESEQSRNGRTVRAAVTLQYLTATSPLPQVTVRLYDQNGDAYDTDRRVALMYHPAAGGRSTTLQREPVAQYRLNGDALIGYVNSLVNGQPLLINLGSHLEVIMPDNEHAPAAYRAIRPDGMPVQPEQAYQSPYDIHYGIGEGPFARPAGRDRHRPAMVLLEDPPPLDPNYNMELPCAWLGQIAAGDRLGLSYLVYELADGRRLWRVTCKSYGINPVEVVYIQTDPAARPQLIAWPRANGATGLASARFSNLTVDPLTGQVSATEYDPQQLQDPKDQSCGTFEVWEFDPTTARPVMLEARQMPLCRGLPQSDWLRTHFAGRH